jgi:hypothetical protein
MDAKTDRAIKEQVDTFLEQTKKAHGGVIGLNECYHAARIGYWLAMRGKKEAARTAEAGKGAGK